MCDAKTQPYQGRMVGLLPPAPWGVEAEHHHGETTVRPGKCFSSAELTFTPESEAIIINEEKLRRKTGHISDQLCQKSNSQISRTLRKDLKTLNEVCLSHQGGLHGLCWRREASHAQYVENTQEKA